MYTEARSSLLKRPKSVISIECTIKTQIRNLVYIGQPFIVNVGHEMRQRIIAKRKKVWHSVVRLVHRRIGKVSTGPSSWTQGIIIYYFFMLFPDLCGHEVPVDCIALPFIPLAGPMIFFVCVGPVSDSSPETNWKKCIVSTFHLLRSSSRPTLEKFSSKRAAGGAGARSGAGTVLHLQQ